MNFPSKIFEKAVEHISFLPGIGKKSAVRMALFLLSNPKEQTENLANALHNLVTHIKYCTKCYNISDFEICEICSNPQRDEKKLCIVEDVRDVMAIENTNRFNGLYHVLGGKISPLEGVGPAQLKIIPLVERVQNIPPQEIIMALSPTMEGDTTVYYIYKLLKDYKTHFTMIARGIGVGNELEYTDEITLAKSIDNRQPYHH